MHRSSVCAVWERESAHRHAMRHGLQELLALRSSDRSGDGVIRRPLSEVCSRLQCAPVPWPVLPVSGWWLAGGAVLAWLLDGPWVAGDLDVFCQDVSAAHACVLALEEQGGRLTGLSTWNVLACWRCGSRVGRQRPWTPFMAPRLLTCQTCLSSLDAHATNERQARVAQLLPLTPDTVASLGLMAVEFQAPDARAVQVVLGHLHRSPAAMFRTFDLSVCQIALDADTLYLSEAARCDILERRVGVSHVNHPVLTLRRLLKYDRRGFRVRWQTLHAIFPRTARGMTT